VLTLSRSLFLAALVSVAACAPQISMYDMGDAENDGGALASQHIAEDWRTRCSDPAPEHSLASAALCLRTIVDSRLRRAALMTQLRCPDSKSARAFRQNFRLRISLENWIDVNWLQDLNAQLVQEVGTQNPGIVTEALLTSAFQSCD